MKNIQMEGDFLLINTGLTHFTYDMEVKDVMRNLPNWLRHLREKTY